VFVVPTDVTNASKVAELASAAASFGQIDGWVSNAGVGAVGKPTNHLNQSGWTHQRRPRRYSDLPEAGPRDLREHDFTGRVSRGAYASAYSASKFGLKGFSEALRVELSDYPDIHVCDIYPSFMDTPGISHGANYTGKKLSAPPPVYDARSVANAIVRVSDHPVATTTVGAPTDLVRFAHLLAPTLTPRFMNRFMRTYFKSAEDVPITDRNLYAPSSKPGDGGLRSTRQRFAVGAVVATISTLAIAMLVGRRGVRRGKRRFR
jgi:NAD(P)-dependent dehydrogenase (short-subunit alcohol dehydrogenase family)